MNEAPTPSPAADFERRVLMALALFVLAAIVYIPAMSGGFIYDDDTLLTENPLVTRGSGFFAAQSWRDLGAIWLPVNEKSVNDYAPLSTTTYWIEWRLWGEGSPGGYHATNVLLHAIAALLLWAVLARIGVPGAYAAALVWAVHPVCAESVAWIAERRNVLSTPLLLLAFLAWLRFQAVRERRAYVAALLLFAAALLAKSAVVMLPCFMLLWAWWSRGRVVKRDLIETFPFFLLSLALGCVTAWFQYARAIAREQTPVGGLIHRAASACFALAFYMWKTVFPFHLDFNYPEWHNSLPVALQALAIVPFAAVFAWAWRERAGWGRHVILGLGFFVLMIAPALGIMKMAYMRITLVADHFDYVPMIGLIALAAAGVARLWRHVDAAVAKRAIVAATAGVVALLGVFTWKRAVVFHDAEALWVDTLAGNPDAWQAHEHLGGILKERRDFTGALEHFRRGAELRPGFSETHNNYGNALRDLGLEPGVALEENRKAVAMDPDNLNARLSYAGALAGLNRPAEAIVQYEELLKRNPGDQASALISFEIGELFLSENKRADAAAYYAKALQFAPNFPAARQRLDTLNSAVKYNQ